MAHSRFGLATVGTLALVGSGLHGDEEPLPGPEAPYELKDFTITEQQSANIVPVSTYDTPVSNLEFNPRIDFQSRNMSEAQGDVTIRGGIFENTGFRVGSATLVDPQTGHYFAELPIAPEMLSAPEVLLAADNALYGFNSTVGTINYTWTRIKDGGSATLGAGDSALNFQRIHHALSEPLGTQGDWSLGVEAEYSRSESDGTVAFGDHDFDRSSGRLQVTGPQSQTDLFVGYQSKFFGWPELYAAPFGSNETENLKTRLYLLNHLQTYDESSYLETSAYHRRHSDHYIFDRANPNNAFIHESKVSALGLSGKHEITEQFSLNYAAQFTTDEIDSTALNFGDFDTRSYTKLSILAEYQFNLKNDRVLVLRAGANYDDTNRAEAQLSPVTELSWEQQRRNGELESLYLSYSETSQVAGYTALNSDPEGFLFGGDATLGRETSRNIEVGGRIKRSNWTVEAALFYRWDDDLVDWTYAAADINNRTARPVDIKTVGFECVAQKSWGNIEAIASYTLIDKDEDYGTANVIGSFYALNYANHRATLGAIWTPLEIIKFRIDNEWRSQVDNPARTSDAEAIFTHISLSVYPPQIEDMELFVALDNAWDDDFEEVPGTPGRGDQFSAGATYSW